MFNANGPGPDGPTSHSFAEASAVYGLHPLVAFGMFAVDHMLFAGLEVPSMGLLAVISAFVGFAFAIPCALIQRHYGDSWGAAIGKALVVSLLTAIPSPLPAYLTGMWGIAGFIGMRHREAQRRTIDTDGEER